MRNEMNDDQSSQRRNKRRSIHHEPVSLSQYVFKAKDILSPKGRGSNPAAGWEPANNTATTSANPFCPPAINLGEGIYRGKMSIGGSGSASGVLSRTRVDLLFPLQRERGRSERPCYGVMPWTESSGTGKDRDGVVGDSCDDNRLDIIIVLLSIENYREINYFIVAIYVTTH